MCTTTAKVSAQCSSCGGTGIYCGYAEKEGTGIVCRDCNGTGERTIEYVPFTGRKDRTNVTKIFPTKGSYEVQRGESISYEDFKNGKMPQPPPDTADS